MFNHGNRGNTAGEAKTHFLPQRAKHWSARFTQGRKHAGKYLAQRGSKKKGRGVRTLINNLYTRQSRVRKKIVNLTAFITNAYLLSHPPKTHSLNAPIHTNTQDPFSTLHPSSYLPAPPTSGRLGISVPSLPKRVSSGPNKTGSLSHT